MSSFLRRTFSRRLPDHLVEISECIYVFDSCLTTSAVNEKEFKSYLNGVVTSLQRFHAGASFMVFNFKEGDEISLLSDILIDYDMTVVDYPRNHEGYPLLPLEMINYILRSSESWLSLAGQRNVILMHCEQGGWPVLAFMLAGLLLYRKQYSGEQKTIEMMYKYAPKQVFSVLSPINARASQIRYLRYITGRDSGSDWPPPEAPLIVDLLLLHNLPLFDGGKGCRPVVRVYGQDPSEKAGRGPKLLLSTLMAEEPAWQYPKEECMNVKLQLRCQVQGDVFLECIHLYDDLVTEELIFKVMFHTGFIQSNLLALDSREIDVPWNPKYQLPKDFQAEVLFRDINEAPPHITMELGGGEEYRDDENEFFEVEEIFTPMSESPCPSPHPETTATFKLITDQDVKVLDGKKRDLTLHNGAPRWDSGNEVTDLASLKDISVNGENLKVALEGLPQIKDIVVTEVSSFVERDVNEGQPKQISEEVVVERNGKNPLGADHVISASKNIVSDLENDEQASEKESGILESKNIALVDDTQQKQASVSKSDNMVMIDTRDHKEADEGHVIEGTSVLKSIVFDENNHIQALEIIPPASGSEKAIYVARDIVLADIFHKETEIQYEAEASDTKDHKEADEGHVIEGTSVLKSIVFDDINHIQALEIIAPALGSEKAIYVPRDIVLADIFHKESDIQYEAEANDGHDIQSSGGEIFTNTFKNVVVNESNHIQALEKELDVRAAASELESGISALKNVVLVENKNHEQASAIADIGASKSVDIPSHKEDLETEGYVIQALGAKPVTSELKNTEFDHIKTPKIQLDVNLPASEAELAIVKSKNIVLVEDKSHNSASGAELDVSASIGTVEGDIRNHEDVFSEAKAIKEQDIQTSEAKLATSALKNIVVDDSKKIQVPETELGVSARLSGAESSIKESKNIILVDDKSHKQASERELDISASNNVVTDEIQNHKKASEILEAEVGKRHDTQVSEADSVISETIIVDEANHIQVLETELYISDPLSIARSGVCMSKHIAEVDDKSHEQVLEIGFDTAASQNTEVGDIGNHKEDSEIQYDINESNNNLLIVDRNHRQASDIDCEVSAPASGMRVSENITLVDNKSHKQALEIGLDIGASKNIVVGNVGNQKEVSETQSDINESKNNDVIFDRNHKQASDIEPEVSAQAPGIRESENIILVDYKSRAPEIELGNSKSKNIVVVDLKNHKEASETQSEIHKNNVVIVDTKHKQASDMELEVSASKNIVVVDDGSQIQHVKVEIQPPQPKVVPSSSKPKQNKRNRWQDMTAKTITQQRVVSQWVPRTKPAASEPTKPKATAYKWVPKGPTTPSGES